MPTESDELAPVDLDEVRTELDRTEEDPDADDIEDEDAPSVQVNTTAAFKRAMCDMTVRSHQ